MRLDWQLAGDLVTGAQTVLIVTHVQPDGDAIGSMLGLAHALRGQGKTVVTAVDEGVPENLAFLPGAADVYASLEDVPGLPVFDLIIAVDCGDETRMGEVGHAALATGKPLINVDHHRTNTLFGQANLVDLTTVATAEGVLDWLDRLGIAIDPVTAYGLMTGIVTDTLCFRTDNVTSQTLGKAQRLMADGAPLGEIVQRTVSRTSYQSLQLWGMVLPTVRLEHHVIYAIITQAMYQAIDYPEFDDAGLVSTLVTVEEAYIAVVFREQPDGAVMVGMRAVPGFDTSEVAVALDGGGHALASGATVNEPLATVVPRVVALLQDAVRKGDPVVK